MFSFLCVFFSLCSAPCGAAANMASPPGKVPEVPDDSAASANLLRPAGARPPTSQTPLTMRLCSGPMLEKALEGSDWRGRGLTCVYTTHVSVTHTPLLVTRACACCSAADGVFRYAIWNNTTSCSACSSSSHEDLLWIDAISTLSCPTCSPSGPATMTASPSAPDPRAALAMQGACTNVAIESTVCTATSRRTAGAVRDSAAGSVVQSSLERHEGGARTVGGRSIARRRQRWWWW